MCDCFRSRTLRTADATVKMPNRYPEREQRGPSQLGRNRAPDARNFRYTADVTTSQTSRRPRPSTTIANVAEQAGVSSPTVSKVINGRADVSLATRQRVEAVIREQGYERSARSVRSAPLIEVIFHEFESDWALEIIKGVELVARENNLAVVLSEMQGRTPGRGWIEGVLARRPGGVIAVLSDLSDVQRELLASRNIPLVAVDPTGEPLHDTPSIGATNWSGGLTATRHLLGLGHRRIGVIAGPESVLCSRARLDGYRAAMDEADVPIDPDLIRHGNFHVQEGITEGRRLLNLPDPPTAIFAGNDLQALGVYQAAREARLHIPEDLSVVGFDDLPVAKWVGPPLTTIRQPLAQMAASAARLVLALARGEQPAQTRVELATELIIRESTAPPRR
jgi:DNA-binding LacI/PurR family transcriptional regulator